MATTRPSFAPDPTAVARPAAAPPLLGTVVAPQGGTTEESTTLEDERQEVTGRIDRPFPYTDPYTDPPGFASPSQELLEQTVGIWRARTVATVQEMADALLAGVLPPETVVRSLMQTSGAEGLQLALSEYVGAVATEPQRDRYYRLLDLEKAKKVVLERAGGVVSVDEVRPLLGDISRQAVEKRRERGGLLALRSGGEYRYPLCQFADGAVLPGLPDVLRAFTVRSPWTQLSVLVAEQDALDGRSILDALRDGDVDEAVATAASFGNTGA